MSQKWDTANRADPEQNAATSMQGLPCLPFYQLFTVAKQNTEGYLSFLLQIYN